MLGNALEWIDTPMYPSKGSDFEHLKAGFPRLSPPLSPTERFYQVRGGSYKYPVPGDPSALLWDSITMPARALEPDLSFRCAKDVRP